jgi:NTP pyrophosphatase (non-canonical NTP hydrolase)
MDFNTLTTTNQHRCELAFHPIDHWSPTDWGCAMAGECGEACNLIKKLRRLEGTRFSRENEQQPLRLVDGIMDELADMVIYADLLATRLGRSLEQAIISKFNRTSDEVHSDIKLPLA